MNIFRPRTIVRDTARLFFAVFGLVQLILFTIGGFAESAQAVFGAMLFMMAATNFCSQCPLFSAVKHLLHSKKSKTIPTEKI
jgi:hypothetical protein